MSFSSAASRELFPLPTIPATPTSSPWLTERFTSAKACLNSGTAFFLTFPLFVYRDDLLSHSERKRTECLL